MKNLILLSVISLFVSCGQIPGDKIERNSPTPENNDTNQDLAYYQETFQQNAQFHGKTPVFIPINFKNLEYSNGGSNLEANYLLDNGQEVDQIDKRAAVSRVVGVCYSYQGKGLEIFIDPVYWNKASESQRKALIDHELGHCAYNRDHDTDLHNHRPTSVMYPTIVNNYEAYYEEYQEELHTHNKDAIELAFD